MGHHQNTPYTEEELREIVFAEDTNPKTKFVFVANGNGDYVFCEICKRENITIEHGCFIINTEHSSASKPIDKVILVAEEKECNFY